MNPGVQLKSSCIVLVKLSVMLFLFLKKQVKKSHTISHTDHKIEGQPKLTAHSHN